MYSQEASVRNILEGYLKEERNLEKKIKECTERRFNKKSNGNGDEDAVDVKLNLMTICPTESGIRNERFLKDLEESKARLRTIASFTPTDQELRVLAGAYRGLLGNAL